MKLSDRIRGDGLALLIWGAATCASCRSSAQIPADVTRVAQPPRVTFDSSVLNMLEFGYFLSQAANVENGWCLYGTKTRAGNYEVAYTRHPFVHEAGPHHIKMSCRDAPDFLGLAHTHDSRQPYNIPCSHSPVDREGFAASKKARVSAVYCGGGNISTMVKP